MFVAFLLSLYTTKFTFDRRRVPLTPRISVFFQMPMNFRVYSTCSTCTCTFLCLKNNTDSTIHRRQNIGHGRGGGIVRQTAPPPPFHARSNTFFKRLRWGDKTKERKERWWGILRGRGFFRETFHVYSR